MRGILTTLGAGVVALACLAGPSMPCRASTPDETIVVKSSRGGILVTAEGHRFEVFFYPTGVRVFPLDPAGKPMDAARLTGLATFYHPNDPDSPWFARSLHPAAPTSDHVATSLDLSVGLGAAPKQGATVHFEIIGLESKTSSTADFVVPLSFVAAPAPRPAVVPAAVASKPAATGESASRTMPTRPALASSAASAPAVTTLGYVPAATVPATLEPDGYRTFGTRNRDWSTGRTNLPLSRPWLYPDRLRQ